MTRLAAHSTQTQLARNEWYFVGRSGLALRIPIVLLLTGVVAPCVQGRTDPPGDIRHSTPRQALPTAERHELARRLNE